MTISGGAQWVVYGLWFVLEVAIAATDLAEVIGSGTAIYLLSNGVVPLWAGVLITALDVLLILMMGTRNFRSLELLVATFIALIAGIFACAPAWLSLYFDLSSQCLLLCQTKRVGYLKHVRRGGTVCWTCCGSLPEIA